MENEIKDPPDRLARWVDHPLLRVGGAGLLLMMVATVVSSLGAALFSRPVPDIVTIDEVLMAFVVFLPLAFVQLQRDHIEVTIATDWLAPRPLEYLRLFGALVTLGVFALLFWGLAIGAHGAWDENDLYTGEYSVPSWPVRAVAAIGVLGFLIRLLADIAKIFRHLKVTAASRSSSHENLR
jgi:TRAP-type C4-dicarboxylate transport system permease small subunit